MALNLFLESLREREGIEAVAVTTEEGLLVAGVGEADVEYMGAIGAASKRSILEWDDKKLHVQKMAVNDVPMYLTSTSRRAHAASVELGFQRILGWT